MNRARLLERLLINLELVEGVDLEVIVVDNISSDETPDVLRRYADTRPNVSFVRNEVSFGVGHNRNIGLSKATSPYVSFIDDDDLTAPDRLISQYNAIQSTPGARWSFAGTVSVDDDLNIVGTRRVPVTDDLLAAVLRSNVIPGASQGLLVETDLLRELGGFDPGVANVEDWDVCIRLVGAATVAPVDRPLAGYRVGAPSMTSNTVAMERAIHGLIAKHATISKRVGASLDEGKIQLYLGAIDLQCGRRLRSFDRHVRAAVHTRGPRPIVKGAIGLVSPRRAFDLGARRASAPTTWGSEAEPWLRRIADACRERELSWV